MDLLKPPHSLSFEGNVAENWQRWVQQFRLYLNATGGDKKPEKVQCLTLLTIAGKDAVQLYNTFTFTTAETDKLEALISKFEAYCIPKKNVTFERHVFNTRNQRIDETFDSYVTELRKLAKRCEFGELCDSLIRDRIVCGIHSTFQAKSGSASGYSPGQNYVDMHCNFYFAQFLHQIKHSFPFSHHHYCVILW